MGKTVRNALIAAAVAALIGFLLEVLPALVDSSSAGGAGWTLAVALGCITFFILHFVSANRRTAAASPELRERALSFRCAPDEALVYFVRTGFAGKAVGVDLVVDGGIVAQIKSPRFACVQLAPGAHEFAARIGAGDSALKPGSARQAGVLAPGSVTVLHVAIQRSMLKSQLVFEPWSLETAKARLPQIAMVAVQSPIAPGAQRDGSVAAASARPA